MDFATEPATAGAPPVALADRRAFKNAMKEPVNAYFLRRLEATRAYFDDDAAYLAMAKRSARKVNGKKPWAECRWEGLARFEALIARAAGRRYRRPLDDDQADGLFRWWSARMAAALAFWEPGDPRTSALGWAVEEARRRDGEAAQADQWRLLDVLEERVLDATRDAPVEKLRRALRETMTPARLIWWENLTQASKERHARWFWRLVVARANGRPDPRPPALRFRRAAGRGR